MPKLFAVGTNLFSSLRRLGRRSQALAMEPRRAGPASAALIEPLEPRQLLAATWMVAPWGNDAAAGTAAQPFRTIQRAATLANGGDTVLIRGGVYRETVHPAHGGVTFEAYNGENVTVSGADVVSGWSPYSGDIYQAHMPWDLGEGRNQIFLDGQPVNEARWPNTSADLSHPLKEGGETITTGAGWATITDPQLSGGWQGGQIQIMSGEGWWGQSGTITASGPGWLTFTFTPDISYLIPRTGNLYYLMGKFQGLDSPGEWYRDPSGQLYLWTAGSDNPAGHLIEAKSRQFAFDLSGDANITLQGINIFAATIKTDAASANFVMNACNANYLSQFTWADLGNNVPWDSGIELNGAGSTVENSVMGFSSGDGVYVNAPNCRVTNNVIHDVDFNAGDSAAVRDLGNAAMIDHNLIFNTGRSGILLHAWGSKVIGNTIHDVMLQTADGGAIYTIHQDGAGSEIGWNTIYNAWATVPTQHRDWFANVGIFLDDTSWNWWVHDNTIWNVDAGIKLNSVSRGNSIVSNQVGGWVGSVVGNWLGDWMGTTVANNALFSPMLAVGAGAAVYGNQMAAGTPQPHPLPVPPAVTTPPSYLNLVPASSSTSADSGGTSGSASGAERPNHRHGSSSRASFKLRVRPPRMLRSYRPGQPATIIVPVANVGNQTADQPLTIALFVSDSRKWKASLTPVATLAVADPHIRAHGSKLFQVSIANLAGVLPPTSRNSRRAGPHFLIAMAQSGTSYALPTSVTPDQAASSVHVFSVKATPPAGRHGSPGVHH